MPAHTSPQITHISWGQIQVAGYTASFKDVKLYPGGARSWDWNETGTRHAPGIQPADVEELIDRGAETVVLSRGMQQRLQIAPETLDYLKIRGITVHILETTAAAALYNQLAATEPVGGLFHTTC